MDTSSGVRKLKKQNQIPDASCETPDMGVKICFGNVAPQKGFQQERFRVNRFHQ